MNLGRQSKKGRRWTDRIDPSDFGLPGRDGRMGRMSHVLLFAVLAFALAFIAWAQAAPLDEVTRGDGKIIPSSQTKLVQHLEGGILAKLLVEEGQIVERGQILMRIANRAAEAELGERRKKYFGLLASASRVEAEARGLQNIAFPEDVIRDAQATAEAERHLFDARQVQLRQQLEILESQVEQKRQERRGLASKVEQLRLSRDLAQQEYDLLKPLVAQGAAPRLELLRVQQKLQDLETQVAGVELALPRTKAAIEEAERRIEEKRSDFRSKAQEELNRLRVEVARIREEIGAGEDRNRRTEIPSPVRGTVNSILINTIGGVVRPGDDLVEIVPLEDTLLVEARIRPSDRAQLWPGLGAVVKVSAYDYARYGGLEASLIDISPDTITDEKGDTYYRIRLRTDRSSLGPDLPIVPGMTASVDILTGQKTVLDYILKPILRAQENALRER